MKVLGMVKGVMPLCLGKVWYRKKATGLTVDVDAVLVNV